MDKREILLTKAILKGYLDDCKIFSPFGFEGWFEHSLNENDNNYRYNKDEDSFSIPAIGIGNNISSGCFIIYKEGAWCPVGDEK